MGFYVKEILVVFLVVDCNAISPTQVGFRGNIASPKALYEPKDIRPAGKPGHRLCVSQCPLDYKPVCHSGGVLYCDQCYFGIFPCADENINNTFDVLPRPPHRLCVGHCPNDYEPFDGSNGVLYCNQCYLEMFRCAVQNRTCDVV